MLRPLLRVTHRQQQYPADCLAACAAMTLNYLGQSIDYGRLIRLLQINLTIGAPFRHLTLLDRLDVKVKLMQGTLADLDNWLEQNVPPIVFFATRELPYWTEDVFHAAVLVGLDNHQIFLDDPAFEIAPQIVSDAEFDLAWAGRDYFYAVIQQNVV